MLEIILATLTGLLFPTVLFLLKDRTEQRHKRKELEDKLAEKQSNEMKLLTEGVCLLIRLNIIDYHKRYTQEKSIPLYALENVKTLFNVYNMFGENGVHDLMEEIYALPIRN